MYIYIDAILDKPNDMLYGLDFISLKIAHTYVYLATIVAI